MKNKNVLIIGAGESGKSAAKLCSQLGAQVTIYDEKTELDLQQTTKELEEYQINMVYEVNKELLNFLEMENSNRDIVIPSPGFNATSLKKLKERAGKTNVIGEIELGFRFCPCPIVAVTGTNGKSTTATLINKLINSTERKSWLCGNIGIGFADKTLSMKRDDVVTLEVSAAQLEHIENFKPYISVITNINKEHLDRYGDFNSYYNLKSKIFDNQDKDQYCVINLDDNYCSNLAERCNAKKIFFSQKHEVKHGVFVKNKKIYYKDNNVHEEIIKLDALNSTINLENILISICVAKILDIPIENIKGVLSEFSGIEHRLEYVHEINKVKYYNDTKATNPHSTVHAITTFEKPVILITGGKNEKMSDFEPLCKLMNEKVKELILIGETSEIIAELAIKYGYKKIYKANTLNEAVDISFKISEEGDHVVFSPGANSKDMFKNHIQRGKIFKSLVGSLLENKKIHNIN